MFVKRGNLIHFSYQGTNISHNVNDLLFTLPEEYRPPWQCVFPFVKEGKTYGVISISTNGQCTILTIEDTTEVGRIYATGTYSLKDVH